MDETRFPAICQNALEGLASKRLNLEMLIERRAKAQERRVIPETIARFLSQAAGFSTLALKAVPSLPHTYDPGRTPTVLKDYERNPDWRLPSLLAKYPRLSTHRERANNNHLEWVTPGHPLFEAVRRHTYHSSQQDFKKGACFFSLAHEAPARIDFYRARVVDGLGNVIHEVVAQSASRTFSVLRLAKDTSISYPQASGMPFFRWTNKAHWRNELADRPPLRRML